MNPPNISIAIEGIDESRVVGFDKLCEQCITETIEVAGLNYEADAELSVLLADDQVQQRLNEQWRQIAKPTNVLSFPGSPVCIGDKAGRILGDIAISIDTLDREAALENKPRDAHFCHLVVHGFLHLFGYDHETDRDAELMEGLEAEALSRLGIPDPYAVLE